MTSEQFPFNLDNILTGICVVCQEAEGAVEFVFTSSNEAGKDPEDEDFETRYVAFLCRRCGDHKVSECRAPGCGKSLRDETESVVYYAGPETGSDLQCVDYDCPAEKVRPFELHHFYHRGCITICPKEECGFACSKSKADPSGECQMCQRQATFSKRHEHEHKLEEYTRKLVNC